MNERYNGWKNRTTLAGMEYEYPFEAEKKAQMIVDAGAREDFNRTVIV